MKILERLRNRSSQLVNAGIRPDPPATRADVDHPPVPKANTHRSPFDRVDLARDERNERERLRDEARYRRERLELYRARLYGGRAASQDKLRELQRASDGAAARHRRAEARIFNGRADGAGEARRSRQAASPSSAFDGGER
jgi:hypothetical protein